MKRVEVIADDEDEIIEAVRRMSNKYDFVVTSGGIGPTFVQPNTLLPCAAIECKMLTTSFLFVQPR